MFSEQNCFTSYTKVYSSQLVTIYSFNHILIISYKLVSFHTKLLFGQIILVIL